MGLFRRPQTHRGEELRGNASHEKRNSDWSYSSPNSFSQVSWNPRSGPLVMENNTINRGEDIGYEGSTPKRMNSPMKPTVEWGDPEVRGHSQYRVGVDQTTRGWDGKPTYKPWAQHVQFNPETGKEDVRHIDMGDGPGYSGPSVANRPDLAKKRAKVVAQSAVMRDQREMDSKVSDTADLGGTPRPKKQRPPSTGLAARTAAGRAAARKKFEANKPKPHTGPTDF